MLNLSVQVRELVASRLCEEDKIFGSKNVVILVTLGFYAVKHHWRYDVVQ